MKGLCVVAPTETLARKKYTAQWFRRSQTLIEFPIFCAENGQSIGKQRMVEEKAPRNRQNVEAFEQNLHPYWSVNHCFAACG